MDIKIILSRSFIRGWKKLPTDLKNQFKRRRDIFLVDQFATILNNHKLSGKYADCRSFNVTGDYRVIYRMRTKDLVEFIAIGTHSKLYE